jgi:hypothetical protein
MSGLEIWLILGALVALALLSARYGHDSRELDRPNWWSTPGGGPPRRSWLPPAPRDALGPEAEWWLRTAELHAEGAQERWLRAALPPRAPGPHRRAVAALGTVLVALGERLQRAGQPAPRLVRLGPQQG